MQTKSYLCHALLASFLCFATISQAAEIIFRPAPGLNDGTDTGTATAGQDASSITCDNPFQNSGSVDYLAAWPQSTCNQCFASTWLRFDVSTLPRNVTNVYLGFTHFPHPQPECLSNCDADFYFYPATSEWDEMTVSLATPPSRGAAAFGPVHLSYPEPEGNREYEITTLYRQWKTDVITNYGIEISSPTTGCSNEAVGFYTHSSDAAIESQRPYLRIVTSEPPVCDIQLNKPSFVNGDQVIAQVAQLANPGPNAVLVEVKLWFEGSGGPPVPFLSMGADGSFVLPPGFNQDYGPLPLATVQASYPRGSYQFNCRLLHAVTGETLAEDSNPFTLQ